ncbi:GPN-loop GTPase 3-like [Dioscorea cayenensis subsp. rotundata]|uniref:GPN-loop GTPase 3 n=1 Tax=Dioscorea cayennensis subsp. rotundata TaxID=55577 RepID=A0AB40AXD8_DIOCR|nr:GPN-loop GTPase 3-like [Dioscorea cayenensis subsp. rotundata]
MGYAQLFIGPTTSSGKSTYCSSLYQHIDIIREVFNLDLAAKYFDNPVAMDIRELISLDDVMEELGLGRNGGLIYCMEYPFSNLDDWLAEELDNYLDDDYLVFYCPDVRAHVPRMTLDELFEQKNDVAQAVLEELKKLLTDALGLLYGQVCSFQCI